MDSLFAHITFEHTILSILSGLLVFLAALFWRLLPILPQPHKGHDAYYFQLCREAFKKQQSMVITLPDYYALEDREQRYPPGFAILLSLIPDRFFRPLYWAVSPALDALNCLLLFVTSLLLTDNLPAAIIAALFYTFSPAAIRETAYLTSRQFGTLLFFSAIAAGIAYAVGHSQVWLLAACFFGSLLLLSHKLGTQAYVLASISLSIWFRSTDYLWALAGSFVLAIILSKGFYLQILRSHVEFVLFWTRHSPLLRTHEIFNSKIYHNPKYAAKRPFPSSLREQLAAVAKYAIENKYIILAFVVMVASPQTPAREMLLQNYTIATVAIFLAGAAIYLVPVLRGIGHGFQYGKYALATGTVLCALCWEIPAGKALIVPLLLIELYTAAKHLSGSLFTASHTKTITSDWDLAQIAPFFDYLRTHEIGTLMCLPRGMCDLIAYHCKIKVLWGAHGGPVKLTEDILPVWTKPLPELIQKYSITHILVDLSYVSPKVLHLTEPVLTNDRFALYKTDKTSTAGS